MSHVSVNEEVIITGGVIESPHLLMHSGVGLKDVLDVTGVHVSAL